MKRKLTLTQRLQRLAEAHNWPGVTYMEDAEISKNVPSDWQPMTNKHDLAVLEKLGEELCEAATAIFRCLMQGLDECEPVTKKINRIWLQQELADVWASLDHAVLRLSLDRGTMDRRANDKYAYKAPWFDKLKQDEGNDNANST